MYLYIRYGKQCTTQTSQKEKEQVNEHKFQQSIFNVG